MAFADDYRQRGSGLILVNYFRPNRILSNNILYILNCTIYC